MLLVTPEKRKAIQSKGSTRAFSHQIPRSVLFVSLVTQVPSSSRPKQESRRHACTAAYARSKANNWYLEQGLSSSNGKSCRRTTRRSSWRHTPVRLKYLLLRRVCRTHDLIARTSGSGRPSWSVVYAPMSYGMQLIQEATRSRRREPSTGRISRRRWRFTQ